MDAGKEIIEIGAKCYETYPCQHYCTLKNGERIMLNGREIVKRRPDLSKSEHFARYTEMAMKVVFGGDYVDE
jgi:hypothetical protein